MHKIFGVSKKIACLDIHSPLYIRAKDKMAGGDISDIYKVVDKASSAGFSLLQFTPFQDTGYDPCPYMGVGSFSFNPVFLAVDKLPWIPSFFQLKKNFEKEVFSGFKDNVPYRKIYDYKMSVLRKSFEAASHQIFLIDIDDQELSYAVFSVLKSKFKTSWVNWPKEYKTGLAKEIIQRETKLWPEVKFILYCQSTLKKQWQELEKYAREKGIELIFDKPIYPIYDSSDVWANQELFYLNKDGSLRYVSGVNMPGDPYGPQKWGHAVYKFKESPDQVIDYFMQSVGHLAKISKVVRLDHALALIWKYYIVRPDAEKGVYLPALKDRLFSQLKKNFPHIYFIAEDLGFISNMLVDKPLQKFGIPGMRCLQWYDNPRYFNLKKYPYLCMAISSNHDTDSLSFWWKHLPRNGKEVFYKQMDANHKTGDDNHDLMKLIFSSPAKIVSITLRDLAKDLRRYNLPGVQNETNWLLRSPLNLEEIDFESIAGIIKETGRS